MVVETLHYCLLMDKLDDGELIIYSDVGDMFHPELFPYVEDLMGPDDPCLLLIGGFPQKLLRPRETVLFTWTVTKRITGVNSTRRWRYSSGETHQRQKDYE